MAQRNRPAKSSGTSSTTASVDASEQQAKISIEFTAEDLQHLIAMTQVGAQKMIDNIVSKATSLTEEIKQKLPQE